MPYFNCEGCGTVVDLGVFEADLRREHCPVCEETTDWTPAFDDGDGGVSF